MSLIFTNYHGTDDLCLCLAPPNWRTPPKLTAEFPFTDVERAILGNETRRSYGLTKKHTLEYTPTFRGEFDCTAFRLGLNRLKTELVGVPIWTDFCLTNAALSTTGTSVAMQSLPVRQGARWILLAPDGFTFELVTVSSINESTKTLTLAARTGPAWPAGSQIFPMLFGRFAERPSLESITPSRVEGSIRIMEDSDITEQISWLGGTVNIVGSHIPDFIAYRRWSIEPDWVRPIDTTESDILYAQLGFDRQEQAYPQQNWNRRGLEMQFTCRTRADIASIERLFTDRLGPVRSFFVPTFRNDLKLAADVAATDDTFEIATSRFEDAAYDGHPGSAFIAFLEGGLVYPQRITEVSGTTVTIEVAFSEAHAAATTRICSLMLSRFAETKLEWEYVTPSFARVKIKFLELPDEYVDPQPDAPTWAYLFDFSETLPNGTVNRWRFTSFENQITFASNSYLIAPLSLGEREVGLELDDKSELKSWGLFSGNPLARFLPYTLNASLICTITRVTATAPDDGNARVLFVGRVTAIDTTGPEWTATLRDPVAVQLDGQFPRPLYQTQDNFDVYAGPTALDPDDFKTTGTIAALSVGGNTMQITVNGASGHPTDYFSAGYLSTGTGANQEERTILKNTLSGSVQTITLDRPLVTAIVGQSIDLFAGYDGSREQRDLKFGDNAGFEGMPFMPDTNPSIKAADIKTATGGKK